MRTDWDSQLDRWLAAGVLDAPSAARIRVWESSHSHSTRLRWPILIALAFGALLLGAGILLFVAAHWDELSPVERMSLVILLVAGFHIGGALSSARFEALSIALHTVGTMSLGTGIALTGQIFHLSEHWPAAILLWGGGAAAAWALLRHWTQGGIAAILIPYWLCSESWYWMSETSLYKRYAVTATALGVCGLAFTYLSARRTAADDPFRKALGWIGGIAVLPSAAILALEPSGRSASAPPLWLELTLWAVPILLPLGAAVLLRGRDVLWNAVAITWCVLLAFLRGAGGHNYGSYAWCALGAVGLVAWGVRESRAERINLGILGFVITIVFFYFSDVMDMLGRSASLIVLGLLFLGGGWLIERTRRRLIARIHPHGNGALA